MCNFRHFILICIGLHLAFAPVQAFSDEDEASQKVIQSSDFYQLRKQVTELLSDANKEITLVSDFLTDGNIATALYLAKYRKITVTVLLSRAKSKRYLSRYEYLQSQGVQVYFRPKNFPFKAKTLLKIDDNLYEINRDLDILKPSLSSSIKLIAKKWIGYFNESITKATQSKVNKSLPKPKPPQKQSPAPVVKKTKDNNTLKDYANEPSGAYNYDEGSNTNKKSPSGIARKLPRTPIYIKKKKAIKKQKALIKKKEKKKKQLKESKKKPPSLWIAPQSKQKSDDKINMEDIFDEQNND